jgi:hypothetical protein
LLFETIANEFDGAAEVQRGLQVVVGPEYCHIDANGCATDGADHYGHKEDCTIQISAAGYLTATEFNTELSDYIKIGDTRYQWRDGPEGVAVTAGSTFTWHSDRINSLGASSYNTGWVICFSPSRLPLSYSVCADFVKEFDRFYSLKPSNIPAKFPDENPMKRRSNAVLKDRPIPDVFSDIVVRPVTCFWHFNLCAYLI